MTHTHNPIETILDTAIADMAAGRIAPHCGDAATQNDRDNLIWAPHYCDPGHDPAPSGVILGNWNRWPSDLDRRLEPFGVALEWSDEWQICDDCQGAIRTEPDSFGWRPRYSFWENRSDGAVTLCLDCLQASAGTSEDHDPAGFSRYTIHEVDNVSDIGGRYLYAVRFEGSHLGTFEHEDDAIAAARADCDASNVAAAMAARAPEVLR